MYIWRYFSDFGQILPIKNLTKHFDFSSLHKLFLAIANQIKGWGRQREKRGEKKREEREKVPGAVARLMLYLQSLVLSNGQLYVAISRVTSSANIKYIYRGFENVVCSCNFVICTVKYTHLCIRHGVQTSLYNCVKKGT